MSITIDILEEGLPISVIIPLQEKRKKFFYSMVLPLIEANNPIEIIINDSFGSAPKKRNDGLKKSTQPYVFYCDDDILLPSDFLKKMYNSLLDTDDSIGYTYCGYNGIVLYPNTHPLKTNFEIQSMPFNVDKLKRGNYISPMSLFKRNIMIEFDETLKRLEDWDLYLGLMERGIYGKYVEKLRFLAFYMDDGITSNNNDEESQYMKICKKHNFL